MKKILILGLGKVGTLVAVLLSKRYKVTGLDRQKPHYNFKLPFEVLEADVTDVDLMKKIIGENDAVVSALPYYLNKEIAKIAHDLRVHYFDLTEDVATTNYIRELSKTGSSVMAPQCGLALGLIGIIGADLASDFTKIRDIELRVGALPKYPIIEKNYSKMPKKFEAFTTSGGLGTMCETYEGKVDTLNYKSIRYPGHGKLMKFLIQELILKEDKKLLSNILENAKPPVKEDVVYVYAVVEGWKDGKLSRNEFYKDFSPTTIDDHQWRAISWTTAASIAAVVEMVDNGNLSSKGFIKQEEIPYKTFIKTSFGKYFNQ